MGTANWEDISAAVMVPSMVGVALGTSRLMTANTLAQDNATTTAVNIANNLKTILLGTKPPSKRILHQRI